MAIIDINFQEGEVQDYILELPNVVYVGDIVDINIEEDGFQFPVSELPELGGNIFIMSE